MAESYSQYCPISRTLDLVGDRWSLLILRDLYVGTSTFNGLARGLPGLSRSLLAKRLRSFEREGLVEKLGGRYLLTERGRDLEGVLMALGNWGSRWIFGDPREEELDAHCWSGGCTAGSTPPPCPWTGGCCTSGSSTTRAGSGSSSSTACLRYA
jgi:DNA-binding HxlR family transcriptional regulator